LLDLYTDYLLVSTSQASATGLSRMLDGELSHDKITRFLSNEEFTSKTLWKLVKPTVRQAEQLGQQSFLVLDDTVETKPYTQENALICWHYDHTVNKSVKGVNQISSLFYSAGISVPVGVEFVEKDVWQINVKGKLVRKASIGKQELFRRLVKQASINLSHVDYILADSWFSSAENMRFIKQDCGYNFIMPLKKNRKVALSSCAKQAGEYKRLDSLDLQEGEHVRIYLEQAAAAAVDFAIWLTKAVYHNKDGSVGELYLVTSDSALCAEEIKAFYAYRWNVEIMYKSVKSNASYAKSPTGTVRTQKNHFFCSMVAFCKLEQIKLKTKNNHFALKAKLYLPAIKTAFAYLNDIKQGLGISLVA
ncbi:transposase, partial [Catalinimonas sp. 4WD22]|uniref:IS701 family transposase n=1 Tax=Catalinimonas locisalis TaxID=3133978 RepID=UPI0031017EE4